MKYFKIFNTREEYETYAESIDFITPNLSTLRDGSEVYITPEGEPPSNDYLAFVARENATIPRIKINKV